MICVCYIGRPAIQLLSEKEQENLTLMQIIEDTVQHTQTHAQQIAVLFHCNET